MSPPTKRIIGHELMGSVKRIVRYQGGTPQRKHRGKRKPKAVPAHQLQPRARASRLWYPDAEGTMKRIMQILIDPDFNPPTNARAQRRRLKKAEADGILQLSQPKNRGTLRHVRIETPAPA
jgi:hypothetical protein